MTVSRKGVFITAIILFGLTNVLIFALKVEPYSASEKDKPRTNLNHPGVASTFKRFEENAPTIVKLLQALSEVVFAGLWVLDTSLSTFLWVLNETISSSSEFCIRIFGVLFNIVKLLEAFGFGLKFLLELNYAFITYIFETCGCIKAGLKDAVTLVKITIANQTDHVHESSSMALEGMQSLLLTVCNQTWINIQYISSFVTKNVKPPFGLSALDLSMLSSMILSGFQLFVESVAMTGKMFRDGNLFLLDYTYGTLYKSGVIMSENIMALVCTVSDYVTMATVQTIYVVTLPFYCLVTIASNILCMLHYSWESFVNWAGYVDSSLREIVRKILQTIGLGMSSFVYGLYGLLYRIFSTITNGVFAIMYFIHGAIASTMYGITGFVNSYIPGGFLGCIILTCTAVVLYLWHKEITQLLLSSWISLQRMNENTRPVLNDEQNLEILRETDEQEEQHTTEPPLDRRLPQNQTKLKYELQLEKDKQLCVICQDNVKNILLMPCRHVCMCRQCLDEIQQGGAWLAHCPLCRTNVQTTLEVFV